MDFASLLEEERMLLAAGQLDPLKSSLRLDLEGNFNKVFASWHLGRIEKIFELLGSSQEQLNILDVGTRALYQPELKHRFPNSKFHFIPQEINVEKEPLLVESNSVDFALCSEVIARFYEDPMYAMGEINRVLKPGGVLILTTPNLISWAGLVKSMVGISPVDNHKYYLERNSRRSVYEHTPESLGNLLWESGFTSQIWTENVYHVGYGKKALDFFREVGVSLENRGDCIFAIAKKESSVRNRYPSYFYDLTFTR
jgi:SAM-dependent methyltransferase